MMTWHALIFSLVFIGQIALLSWYFPRRIHARMVYVYNTYPPSDYPLLYPKPVERYAVGRWLFKSYNQVMLVLGFLVLAGALLIDGGTFADDGYISEIWPAIFGLLQMVPYVALEISGYSQAREMRRASTRATRSAELRPRRLLDYVSPGLVLGAALAFGLACLALLYADNFQLSFGRDAVQMIGVLIFTNLFMGAFGAYALYGRKINPHQRNAERHRQLSLNLRSIFYCSIVMSAFFMFSAADDLFDLDYLDATLLSIYLQAIAWLSIGMMVNGCRITDVNFEVYRQDGPTGPAGTPAVSS